MACDFELPPRIKLDHGTVSNSGETSGDSRGTSVGANTGKKGSTSLESVAALQALSTLLM